MLAALRASAAAGKTTLVNHILAERHVHGKRVVVIENEFGETSIDHKLLK